MSSQAVVAAIEIVGGKEARGLRDEIAMLEVEVLRQQSVAHAARKYSTELAALATASRDEVATLRQQLVLAEERLRERDKEIHAMKLVDAGRKQEEATSLAVKTVASWRTLKHKYAPPQTRRRQIYDSVLSLMKPIPQNQG